MLERFKVPLEDQVRVSEQSLRDAVAAIFEKMGETFEDAALAAEVLVTAELRGVETHGVSMVSRYLEHYNDGSLKPRPDWRIVRETPATATIDAGRGLVVFLGPKAMRIAMEKAGKVGVGVVTIGNSSHSGPIGHHAMLAAKEDMIGVVMTAAGLLVLPTFGAEPRLGTNPIAIAAAREERGALPFRRCHVHGRRPKAYPGGQNGVQPAAVLVCREGRQPHHRGATGPGAR